LPATQRWSNQAIGSIVSSFTAPVLTLGSRAYSMIDLLILTALLFGVIILAGVLTNLLRARVLQRAGINRGLQEVIAMLTKYAMVTIASVVLLQIWGLDLSSLTILASALGVGIGFGLQDIAKNFGSGLVLVFERPIQVGDFVEVGEFKGTVERIGARSTEIRTLDHVSIIVPNSRFLANEVINWSHRNPVSRLHIPVGVAYHSDPKAVQEALLEAAQNHPDILKSPSPRVLFQGFGDSALDFELLIWTATPNHQFLLKSDLNFLIFDAFQRWQIEIPFPQRDLHLRSVQVTPELEATLNQLSSQPPNDSDRLSNI
jgi:small-conductance mechanosensitive channel